MNFNNQIIHFIYTFLVINGTFYNITYDNNLNNNYTISLKFPSNQISEFDNNKDI